jgi:hypothetical protein
MRSAPWFPCLLLLTTLFLGSLGLQAQTSQNDGNWNDISWSPAGVLSSSDNVTINTTVTIPSGTSVEINDLHIAQNGKLIVNGNLKVNGDVSMDNNSPELILDSNAIVTVLGNFSASNKINIDISSYLIIQGDFIKKGSNNQGEISVDNGKIYIFGTVDVDQFSSCGGSYSGTTATEGDDCDYGNIDDFVNNVPPEVLELISCFPIKELEDQTVCTNDAVTFSIDPVTNVSYQWQVKIGANSWGNITGETSETYILTNANLSLSGNKYRVILKQTSTATKCKIGISLAATLTVEKLGEWTGNTSSDWNTASNWACNTVPIATTDVLIPNVLTNYYPNILTGITGLCNNLTIQAGSSLVLTQGTIQINGLLSNSGSFDAQAGTVNFAGTNLQTIAASSFLNDKIENLSINSSAVVTNAGSLNISGTLLANSGTFNTGDALTLISNLTQTAFIDGSGSGTITGNVTMQRYLDVAFGYKYFSSPFSNTSVGDFNPYMDLVDPVTSFPNFYTYDENREDTDGNDATGWKAYTTSTNSLAILKGYALNFGDTSAPPKTVEITGTVNNGNQQITLYNHGRFYTQGFNLVGNPYPSPIDWDATGWTKTDIDNAIYFFTAGSTNQYTGTYTSYVDGISTDGSSSHIIPSMQGFFVHVSDGTSMVTATLGLTNPVRTDNSIPQEFLKVREPEKAALIRITAAFENEVNTDPAVLYFPHFAELSFEKDKDALKLMNTDIRVPNLYSLTPENKKLSINALPKPGSSDLKKIPLGLKTEQDGWMLIGLKDLENLPTNFNVYLIDSEKRIGQNLSIKPLYRFYAKSGEHESRFHLMFSETELSDPTIAFDEPFSVRTVDGKVIVSLNLESGQSGVLLASNVTGQILDRKNVSEKEIVEIEGIKNSGVYFFSINLKDGMFSKKVLIQK